MKKLTVYVIILCIAMCLSVLISCDIQDTSSESEGKTSNDVMDNETVLDDESDNVNYSDIYDDPYDIFEELVSRGYEGTFEEWVASLAGADGKSAYELAVDNGYNGTVEEWLLTLVGAPGEDGGKGDQGEQGIQGEKGDKGDQGQKGDQGVGVLSAYVDEDLHLWIVLSNGTKIDAGYVGVTTVEPEPEITAATIVVSNAVASAGDTNVEITVALKNNPGVTSMLMKISFDDDALDLKSVTYNAQIGGTGIPLQSTSSPVRVYWAEGFNNVTGDWVFVTLSFDISDSADAGSYDIVVTYNADDIFNADEINVDFDIINGKITVS